MPNARGFLTNERKILLLHWHRYVTRGAAKKLIGPVGARKLEHENPYMDEETGLCGLLRVAE